MPALVSATIVTFAKAGIVADALRTVDQLFITQAPGMTSLSLPSLATVSLLSIHDTPALQQLSLPALGPQPALAINITNNPMLSQCQVVAIVNATGGTMNGISGNKPCP